MLSIRYYSVIKFFVIPAKAGIHSPGTVTSAGNGFLLSQE
ncbi:Uncharacterized protein dnm_004700 [Desulfonema magnum]|uniref:Uncharacterized protein n=1 Tax=Desulfonema magnum TaxID=45655 RepID=A0A975BFY3_9BACT|nr:Uncharacterized protein dnm_004700 [Desulfonema magnum]